MNMPWRSHGPYPIRDCVGALQAGEAMLYNTQSVGMVTLLLEAAGGRES